MTERRSEAEQLRAARLLFERAQAEGIDMHEAKRRRSAERWQQSAARLAQRRCGTVAAAPLVREEGERQLQWWQQ